MDSRDSIEEIKNKLDVVDVVREYIKLEKAGINYKALCPFHNEKTPSFFVSPSRQTWRCFGCGEGGDMFSFIQQIEGVEFPEALRTLAGKAGVQIKRQNPKIRSEKNKSLEICALAAKYYNHQLESKNGALIQKYLKERGINDKSIENFLLGYAPLNGKSLLEFLQQKNYTPDDIEKAGISYRRDDGSYVARYRGRIIFPVFNSNGDVVAFGARKPDDKLAKAMGRRPLKDAAKYINTPQTNIYDKSSQLYGLHNAKIPIRQEDAAVIVEGYTDVILAHQNDFKNVVASSGTSLTEKQLNVLGRFSKNIYTCFDMDAAGDNATRRGIALAQQKEFNLKVIVLQKGYDPADLVNESPDKWEKSVKGAKSVMEFYFDTALDKHDKNTAEGKRDIMTDLASQIANIPSSVEAAHWIQRLAETLGVSRDDVARDVRNFAQDNKRQYDDYKNEGAKINEPKKSLKDLLEQQIIMHLLANKANSKKVKEELADFDRSNIDKLKKDKDLKEQLLFEVEVKKDHGTWDDSELEQLLVNYKKVLLAEELADIQNKIKDNELNNRNNENEQLLKLFNKKARQKSQLS